MHIRRLFRKLSFANNKGFSAKFAQEEESVGVLLKQLNKNNSNLPKESSDEISCVTQHENILFVENSLLPSAIKHGQIISFNNQKFLGQVLTLQERITTVLLLDKFNLKSEKAWIIDKQTSLELIKNKLRNKDMLKLVSSISRSYAKRSLIQSQFHTGHLLIDYVNPLYRGNFILLKGTALGGQDKIMESAIERFPGKVIIATMNSKLEYSIKAKKIDATIYSCTKDSFITDKYLIPRMVLRDLKALRQEGVKDILVVMDNATEFFLAEKTTYVNAKIHYTSNSTLANLYDECGVFSNSTSVTTLVVNIALLIILIEFRDNESQPRVRKRCQLRANQNRELCQLDS